MRLRPGDRFSDCELPDHTRTQHKLSELQGEDPGVEVYAFTFG